MADLNPETIALIHQCVQQAFAAMVAAQPPIQAAPTTPIIAHSPVSQLRSSHIRLHQPDVFDGISLSKFNASTWLASWEIFFRAEQIHDGAEKVRIVTTRLSDMATLWYIQLLESQPAIESDWD